MELLWIGVIIGVAIFTFKIGVDNGRNEALKALHNEIQSGLADRTEFQLKHGVRGTHILPPDGFHMSTDFVIVHADDFKRLLENDHNCIHRE